MGTQMENEPIYSSNTICCYHFYGVKHKKSRKSLEIFFRLKY